MRILNMKSIMVLLLIFPFSCEEITEPNTNTQVENTQLQTIEEGDWDYQQLGSYYKEIYSEVGIEARLRGMRFSDGTQLFSLLRDVLSRRPEAEANMHFFDNASNRIRLLHGGFNTRTLEDEDAAFSVLGDTLDLADFEMGDEAFEYFADIMQVSSLTTSEEFVQYMDENIQEFANEENESDELALDVSVFLAETGRFLVENDDLINDEIANGRTLLSDCAKDVSFWALGGLTIGAIGGCAVGVLLTAGSPVGCIFGAAKAWTGLGALFGAATVGVGVYVANDNCIKLNRTNPTNFSHLSGLGLTTRAVIQSRNLRRFLY